LGEMDATFEEWPLAQPPSKTTRQRQKHAHNFLFFIYFHVSRRCQVSGKKASCVISTASSVVPSDFQAPPSA
jgi:hypothetical protein